MLDIILEKKISGPLRKLFVYGSEITKFIVYSFCSKLYSHVN